MDKNLSFKTTEENSLLFKQEKIDIQDKEIGRLWKENQELQDKLRRRNTQIADLKNKVKELRIILSNKSNVEKEQEYKDFKRCAD